MTWNKMSEIKPAKDCEILFIARAGLSSERIGIVCHEFNLILLKHTDLKFDDILYWIEIPEYPEEFVYEMG